MSDDQQEPKGEPTDPVVESTEAKPRVRKIVRSATTAERPGFETPPASEAGPASTDAPASGRKWDVRAERSALPARPQRPQRGRPGAPRPISPDGAIAGPAGDAEPEAGAEGLPQRPRRFGPPQDLSMPRRPGASGGRAEPAFPRRGPADRSNPEFVDKWLSMPPRKPEDRPPPRGPRPGGPGGPGGPPGERGERRDRGDRGDRRNAGERRPDQRPGDGRPQGQARAIPAAPVSVSKLPTLHETILVGLPKVAAPGRKQDNANKPKTAKEALAAKTAQPAPKPKSEERSGEVVLDKAWLSATGATAEQALKDAGPAADALVDAWLKAQNLEAIAVASNSEALAGPARKAAKRAASVLKSRGVALPQVATAAPAAKAAEDEVIEATFSPPDGRGTMSFTIAKRRGGERAHIAEIIVREGTGIVNAVSGWMSRSQIKEAHQRIADANGVSPAPVSPEWARWRVDQALKENAKSGQLVPLGLERCKELLDPMPASEPAHPAADLEADLGDGSADNNLHAEPEFRGWIPEARAIDELVQKVGSKLSGDEGKDPTKVDEILKEEVKLAADRYFTPEQRTVLSRRMRDIAITIRQRAGEARAKDVLRAAKAIENAGLISSPPSEIEFLRFFFQKGIAFRAQQGGGQLRVPVGG
jgi:hypothetical protein